MTDEQPPGSRPWDDERIPLGVPAESIYRYAVTAGTARRKQRRQRRLVAGVALAVAVAVPLAIVEASHASTKRVEVATSPTSSTTTTEHRAATPTTVRNATSTTATTVRGPATTAPPMPRGPVSSVTLPSYPPPPAAIVGVATTAPTTVPRATTTLPRATTTTVPPQTVVTFSGGTATPLVTITGRGFGPEPVGTSDDVTSCGAYNSNGMTYGDTTFWLKTPYFAAGSNGACTGINIDTWTNTRIVFGFGSSYNTFAHWYLAPGDSYTIYLKGALLTGTVQFT